MIMAAAREAGAGGGTVLKAKGTGAEYTEKFFGFSIASEKEMHLLVTPAQGRNTIMKAIMEKAGLDSTAHWRHWRRRAKAFAPGVCAI